MMKGATAFTIVLILLVSSVLANSTTRTSGVFAPSPIRLMQWWTPKEWPKHPYNLVKRRADADNHGYANPRNVNFLLRRRQKMNELQTFLFNHYILGLL